MWTVPSQKQNIENARTPNNTNVVNIYKHSITVSSTHFLWCCILALSHTAQACDLQDSSSCTMFFKNKLLWTDMMFNPLTATCLIHTYGAATTLHMPHAGNTQHYAHRMLWCLAPETFYTWHTVYLCGGMASFGLQHRGYLWACG